MLSLQLFAGDWIGNTLSSPLEVSVLAGDFGGLAEADMFNVRPVLNAAGSSVWRRDRVYRDLPETAVKWAAAAALDDMQRPVHTNIWNAGHIASL